MGPLSSIGDSVFKATFMTIFAAIGAALALDWQSHGAGYLYRAQCALKRSSRWLFIKYGYAWGTNLVVKDEEQRNHRQVCGGRDDRRHDGGRSHDCGFCKAEYCLRMEYR